MDHIEEKQVQAIHHEDIESSPPPTDFAKGTDDGLEPGVTVKTWTVIFCMMVGFGFSFFPVPLFGAVQSSIAAELGNPLSVYWFIPAWSLAITVAFMLGGANTDLLGRRWFLILGNVFSFVGHLVIGTAKSGGAAVAGMTIVGFGAGLCQMATFAVPELLPNRWRHVGVALGDLFNALLIIIGPITGRYGIARGTWRWNFYGGAIASFLAFVAMYFLYHPPAHPLNQPVSQVIRELDYLGAVLFVIGSVLVLMGIVWTTQYTGADAHIIAPICVGFFVLVLFALWETYGKAKHPLTPTAIFTSGKGRDFTAPVIAVFINNMYFYSQNILWPSMIGAFWSAGGTDWHAANLLSIVQGGSIFFGSLLLMFLGGRIKHWNYQLTTVTTVMVVFGALGALAAPQRKSMMIAFSFISGSAFVWALFLAMAISQLGVEHQKLGVAGGLAGTFRMSGGVIATSVYTAIITRKITAEVVALVPAAAIKAGLSASAVPDMMATIGTPALVADYSPAVVAAVGAAYELAQQQGIRLVALCSIAFGGVGIIACCCCKDVEEKMNNRIEVFLENDVNAAHNKVH